MRTLFMTMILVGWAQGADGPLVPESEQAGAPEFPARTDGRGSSPELRLEQHPFANLPLRSLDPTAGDQTEVSDVLPGGDPRVMPTRMSSADEHPAPAAEPDAALDHSLLAVVLIVFIAGLFLLALFVTRKGRSLF